MSGLQIYQIDIEKGNETERWTNVYHVQTSSFINAHTSGDLIVAQEKRLHTQHIQFLQMRIRPYPSAGQQGTVYQLSGVGDRSAGEFIPLFNVGRVTFTVEQGRPSRKYYRLPVGEGEQQYGTFLTSFVTTINAILVDFLNIAGLCDESGNEFLAVTLVPTVGMRQLRRGSKRRASPVL